MKKPNFVIFMADQLRFDYLGCNGHKIIKTPNIDQIASEGTNFSKFYVASPVCMPNRASLMTCLLYTSPSPRDAHESRMPSSA